MKKILVVLLAVLIIMFALISCIKEDEIEEIKPSKGLELDLIINPYTRESSYAVIGVGTCRDKEIIIPSEYNNLPVTMIHWEAFLDCTEITSVVIPDSVTYLDGSVFKGCTSLKSVVMSNSLTSIGSNAFDGCISLTSVTIPKSVEGFGMDVFNNCTSLTDIYYLGDVEDWLEINFHYLNSNPMIYAKNLYFNGKLVKEINIPESVSTIGVAVFMGFDWITSIKIPDSVTSIGDSAFCDCESLKSVTIPISVKTIDSFAFTGCESLENIYFEGTIEQWNAIDKSERWNFLMSNYYTIHCSDGDIIVETK